MKKFVWFLALLVGLPNVLLASNSAVVFIYHRFGEAEFASTNTSLEQFDAHLNYLEEAQFTIWPLKRILDAISSGQSLPQRTVAITIDDAYLSIYKEAYPRLKSRGWPFTVFVSTDLVDNGYLNYMSWSQMREMQPFGVSFYNHSASHLYLNRRLAGESESVWLQRIKEDVERAQQRLVAELGTRGRLFAYPYGEYNRVLADMIQQMGYSAFGQQSGAISRHSDQRLLPRYPVAGRYADIEDFILKANTLALPVVQVTPWEPEVGVEPPKMVVQLAESGADLSQLACYASQSQRLPIEWLDQEKGHFAVQATGTMPMGRSRYNCTAPATEKGAYYWFSHLWIRRDE